MIKNTENPWQYMIAGTARRVDLITKYNFFWVCDDDGRFGLMVHFDILLADETFVGQMKGISIAVAHEESTKFYLILHERRDWEMFLAVCCDIVNRASSAKDEHEMIRIINQRIKRWQRFLSDNNMLTIPEKVQMGLFTELSCLKDIIIPAIGPRKAIFGWVGPDADQKDFSVEGCFLEVKSYMSSKGSRITISSLGQLDDDIKPVYLLTYALSHTSSGGNIPELVREIYKLIPSGDIQTLSIFEDLLSAYGYLADITQPPFFSYTIDQQRSYQVVDDFPRILGGMVSHSITNVRYVIDLSRCEKYENPLPF